MNEKGLLHGSKREGMLILILVLSYFGVEALRLRKVGILNSKTLYPPPKDTSNPNETSSAVGCINLNHRGVINLLPTLCNWKLDIR